MGWKDLMKNVTDKATSVAETAQARASNGERVLYTS